MIVIFHLHENFRAAGRIFRCAHSAVHDEAGGEGALLVGFDTVVLAELLRGDGVQALERGAEMRRRVVAHTERDLLDGELAVAQQVGRVAEAGLQEILVGRDAGDLLEG